MLINRGIRKFKYESFPAVNLHLFQWDSTVIYTTNSKLCLTIYAGNHKTSSTPPSKGALHCTKACVNRAVYMLYINTKGVK